MKSLVNKVVGVAVGLLMVAIMFPIALNTMATMNTTGIDPVVLTVLTMLLPILAVIGIALYFIRDIKG